eukprot:NODE_877_length_3349_cov_0.541846.p1 type:complete len:719 gc:universal NODE_877_length_3349_cov_0.541846:588-2744(+)
MFPDLKSILFIYLTMITRLYSISADCPAVMSFLQGLNLHITDPVLYQSIPADCCTTHINNALGFLSISCISTSPFHVNSIYLENVKINGTIKSQFIVPSLGYLLIKYTTLNTTIPSDLPNTLIGLYLDYSNIYGSIPDTLPSQLQLFSAVYNQLTGLPSSFPVLIQGIYLSGNKLTRLPAVFPPDTTSVSMDNNQIYDQLSPSMPGKMKHFHVFNNYIYGTIPSTLPDTITELWIQMNNIQGAIPATLPSQLSDFRASHNRLDTFYSVSQIMPTMDFSYNLFTKMMPMPLNFATLDVSHNLIYQNLTQIDIKNYVYLYINDNMIYGTIPNFPNNQNHYRFGNNQLQGSLPDLPDQMRELDVSGNNLTGPIPILPSYLNVLNLNNNSFTGNLPKIPAALDSFKASHNLLSGNFSNLNTSIRLSELDLSWNKFNGSLVGIKFQLYTLVDLSHNQLSGDIDLGSSTINDLRLSFNQFDYFPKSLPQALKTLNLDNNKMQGNITYDLPSTLKTVDLSNNNLTGNVPKWPTLANRIYYNISNNSFTGSIPQSLQYMVTLDISHNYLSGCFNYQFNGSNFYFNDNYLGGKMSFLAPKQVFLQNNNILDIDVTDSTAMNQNCSLANNPMAPGVFGKTFKNQCNLNGIFAANVSFCKISLIDEIRDAMGSRLSNNTIVAPFDSNATSSNPSQTEANEVIIRTFLSCRSSTLFRNHDKCPNILQQPI